MSYWLISGYINLYVSFSAVVSACVSHPCLHGGTCIDTSFIHKPFDSSEPFMYGPVAVRPSAQSFICKCQSPYSGSLCEGIKLHSELCCLFSKYNDNLHLYCLHFLATSTPLLASIFAGFFNAQRLRFCTYCYRVLAEWLRKLSLSSSSMAFVSQMIVANTAVLTQIASWDTVYAKKPTTETAKHATVSWKILVKRLARPWY